MQMETPTYSAANVLRQIQDMITEFRSKHGFHPLFARIPKRAVIPLIQTGTTTYPTGSHITSMATAISVMLEPTGLMYRGHMMGMMVLSNPHTQDTAVLSNHIISTPNQPELSLIGVLLNDAEYNNRTAGKDISAP